MMKLKKQIDLEAFFSKVHQCQGEVTFHSTENDILNLKSSLCLFLFTVVYTQASEQLNGFVVCQLPEDEVLLKDFLEG